MSFNLADVEADLAAFADDDEDVVIDANGQCLFVRGGEEVQLRLYVDDSDRTMVAVNGSAIPYRQFLSHHLAQLPVLAERIASRRAPVPSYIDSAGTLETPADGQKTGKALELLVSETQNAPAFLSRVIFITADAGQGKTALLRQFQHRQAERFLDGVANYLFWHVDLQGRQLLRLSEALMGDLGDLRVSGLWMPAIIRLLCHRVLVLAIDGFDELAAEQGGSDALGALALLVRQMGGSGTIVAASRRTFFDTDDYVRRAGMFGRALASDCEFAEIRLAEWTAGEARAYLGEVDFDGNRFTDPDDTYQAIVRELGDPQHPMLTRPFLLAQVTKGLLRFGMKPSDFVRGRDDPYRGVGDVIEAFVDREVTEKWKLQETGEPFLTKEQHLRLLSDVAEEMFRAQRSAIDVDVIEAITAILLEEWNVDAARRQQVLQMVKMHVLLTPPADGEFNLRSFDHEEFRDWFTAYALKDRLLRLHDEGEIVSHDLLSVGHLPDATARYVCALIERRPSVVAEILEGLLSLAKREWRPTYLQSNVGTLIPFLLDGVEPTDRFVVDADLVYGSLVHEGKRLKRVTFRNATFVNASLARVQWSDVELSECTIGELTIDDVARFEDVRFTNCVIEGVRLLQGEDETREYAPERMKVLLQSAGIDWSEGTAVVEEDRSAVADGELRKLVRRVLNLFRRTTFLPEQVVERRFRADHKRVLDEVLPLMETYQIVEARSWRGSGRQRAWGLPRSLEEIEKADGDGAHPLNAFWREVDRIDSGAPARRR